MALTGVGKYSIDDVADVKDDLEEQYGDIQELSSILAGDSTVTDEDVEDEFNRLMEGGPDIPKFELGQEEDVGISQAPEDIIRSVINMVTTQLFLPDAPSHEPVFIAQCKQQPTELRNQVTRQSATLVEFF